MGRRARVVPTENLLVPLRLMPANLFLPSLENGLFSSDDTLLPCDIVPEVGVAVLLVIQVVVSLGQLLGLCHLSCHMGCLGHDLLGFGRALNVRGHCLVWVPKENAAHL